MKKVPILPTLLTLGNCICGYGSIIYAAKVFNPSDIIHLETAAALIFFGMILDALDGRIARLTDMSTEFGGQLDSIADITTFGLAPAFIVWKVTIVHFVRFSKFGWLTSALFLMATAIRLARFNVHNSPEEETHTFFQGLPSPAAAGTLASLIVLHTSLFDWYKIEYVALLIPFITLFLAVLMISKIKYSHLMHELFKDRKNFGFLSILIIVGIVVAATAWISLTIIFLAYVISGLVGVAVEQILDRIEMSHEKDSFF